jgi:hypothetical protein
MPVELPLAKPDGELSTETVWTVPELAALLGTSTRTVRRRVASELWPHIRGKKDRVYFTREHVRQIVAAYHAAHDYPAHEPGRQYP